MHRLNGRIAAIFCALRWRAFMAPELPTYPTLATELHRGENQMAEAHLNCVASAVPPHDIHAAFVCFARTLLSRQADRALFDRMVGRAHIAHRYAVLPASIDPAGESLDEAKLYRRGGFPGTALRMHLFERHAPELAAAALGKLSKEAQLGRVTHVIVTSCTGLYAPGLDHTIVQLLGLSGSVERTVVGFMGLLGWRPSAQARAPHRSRGTDFACAHRESRALLVAPSGGRRSRADAVISAFR